MSSVSSFPGACVHEVAKDLEGQEGYQEVAGIKPQPQCCQDVKLCPFEPS
jgi:hypothetical protein